MTGWKSLFVWISAICCTMVIADVETAAPESDRASSDSVQGTGEWRVGPASDSACHVQDIQQAIDNTKANDGGLTTINVRVSGSEAFHLGNIYTIDAADFDNVTTFRITGGYGSCSDATPSGSTVLNADENGRVFDLSYDAGDGDPVRTIILENLEITGGAAPSAGGGVRIEGHAGRHRVQFHNVDIHGNETGGLGSGGGVSIEATAGSTSSINWVSFSQESIIRNNHANGSGGGLACFNLSGQSNPPILLFETPVQQNSAVFHGGGISNQGCKNLTVRNSVRHTVQNSTSNNQAGVDANEGNGGGLFVSAGGELLFEAAGTEFGNYLSANTADHGGGAYVTGPSSKLTLVHTHVQVNFAREDGGGLYVTDGAEVVMGRVGGTVGFVGDCDRVDFRCSRFVINRANNDGGAVYASGGASVEINQTILDGSRSMQGGRGSMFFITGDNTFVSVEGAMVHSHERSSDLVHVRNGGHLRMRWSTIAGNREVDEPLRVFRLVAPANLEFDSSIVWEPGADIVSSFGTTGSVADCVIGHLSEAESGFGSAQFYSQIDPRLADPEGGDLRLLQSSPAVDYCDDVFAPEFNDLFNNPRGVDVGGPLVAPPNAPGGPFDIGAHELQSVQEAIFHDRFE